jgi:hypothetical protein
MNGMETSKTMISHKKKVGIRTSQSGMCIKRDAIHWHKDGLGEMRVMKEFNKVGVVISHGKRLDYSPSQILYPLYLCDFTA